MSFLAVCLSSSTPVAMNSARLNILIPALTPGRSHQSTKIAQSWVGAGKGAISDVPARNSGDTIKNAWTHFVLSLHSNRQF